MDDELRKITREKISSVFTLLEDPHIEESVAGYRVTFKGERGIYIGKEEMSRDGVKYVVELRRASLTAGNPFGLVVWDMRKEKELHALP